MDILVYLGVVLTLLGLAGLGYCVVSVVKAKRLNLPEDEMKSRLQKVVALNMGALFLSAFGLMLIVVGALL